MAMGERRSCGTVKQSVSSFPSPSSANARLVWSGDVVGSVNQRQEASAAVAEAVAAVGEYVQHQPVGDG